MRVVFALVGLGLAITACASAPEKVNQSAARDVRTDGTWTFAVDPGPGLSSATLRGTGNGPILFEMTCDAKNGAVQIRDWTFARTRQGPADASILIGATRTPISGRVLGTGDGRQALSLDLKASDGVWAALTPQAAVEIVIGEARHRLADGGASRLNDVLLACRATGS